MQKSGCLMWNKLSSKEQMLELLKKYEEEPQKHDFFIHNFHLCQEVWKTLVENSDTKMYLEGKHLTVFYPIPDI